MKKIILLSLIIGILASVYSITHVNYQIQRRTLQEMTAARAMVHYKWEQGVLGNPMQYRALVEFLTSKLSPKSYIQVGRNEFLETNYSFYVVSAMRLIVITTIFILIAFYYRKLGFPDDKIFIGLFTFFCVYIIAVSNESISLNTYFDLLFFLTAILICQYNKSWLWILAFMPAAAYNRETSVFIPAIMASLIFFRKGKFTEYLKPAVLVIVWAIVFFWIRKYYPVQTIHNFGPNGATMGKTMIIDNLTNINSLALWLIFPLSAIILYFKKRKILHPFLLQGIALPMTGLALISFYGGTVNEVRVFIIPICLFLIPMFLTEKRLVE